MNRVTRSCSVPVALTVLFALAMPALATNEKNPHIVEVQGTADVNVTNTAPIAVELDQSLSVAENVHEPQDVIILGSFQTSDNAPEILTIPQDMVLRVISVVPSFSDGHPDLRSCRATVRWPFVGNPTHPSSTSRHVMSHAWQEETVDTLNYALPYRLLLPQGAQLEIMVGRIGGDGFCQAEVTLTGTSI